MCTCTSKNNASTSSGPAPGGGLGARTLAKAHWAAQGVASGVRCDQGPSWPTRREGWGPEDCKGGDQGGRPSGTKPQREGGRDVEGGRNALGGGASARGSGRRRPAMPTTARTLAAGTPRVARTSSEGWVEGGGAAEVCTRERWAAALLVFNRGRMKPGTRIRCVDFPCADSAIDGRSGRSFSHMDQPKSKRLEVHRLRVNPNEWGRVGDVGARGE